MARPDIAQLRMVGDVHVVARLPGASVRLQTVSPMERAHIQEAARASVRSETERRQVERQAVGGAAVHGPEKVSLSTMPTYKATAAANAAAASRPTGGNAATGPVTAGNHNPALGRPAAGAAANPAGRVPAKTGTSSGKSNGRERDREKDKK
jgi:hypothetical protein